MKSNEILRITGTAYTDMTRELLAAADLAGELKKKATALGKSVSDLRVGIKPNLVSPTPASYGGTTHPEIVTGIVQYLKEQAVSDIRIMEGSWVGDKTSESFEVCGYNALSEALNVPLVDLQKDSYQLVDCGGMELYICDSARDVDFLITVPVLKGHCQTKITCALKNVKGMIPNKEKRHFHAMGLHKPIAHLQLGIHQDFIVVDHICGDLDFEDGGNPVIRNTILAGLDPVLIDTYVCRLLHYTTDQVPYIGLSQKLGIGSTDLDLSNVITIGVASGSRGDSSDALTDASTIAERRKVVELSDAVEEVESCSACYGYLLPALDMLKAEGLLDKLKDKICIGQGYQGKTGKLGIGRCTKDFDFCVMGCPPVETKIYEELKKYILEQE